MTQSIINYMERDSEERSVINDSKRNSVQSDWNDLILIDVEAEYWRIYNIRNGPDNRSSTVLLAAPVAEIATVPSSSPAHSYKTIKNIVLVPYTPKQKEWGSWQVKKSNSLLVLLQPQIQYIPKRNQNKNRQRKT